MPRQHDVTHREETDRGVQLGCGRVSQSLCLKGSGCCLPGAYAHAPPGDTQQQSNDGEPEEILSWGSLTVWCPGAKSKRDRSPEADRDSVFDQSFLNYPEYSVLTIRDGTNLQSRRPVFDHR